MTKQEIISFLKLMGIKQALCYLENGEEIILLNDQKAEQQTTTSPVVIAKDEDFYTLKELETMILTSNRSLDTGRLLNRIKKSKAFAEKNIPWVTYCLGTFDISQNCINRMVTAWNTFEEEQLEFNREGRQVAFAKLPFSVNFWYQAATSFKDAEKRHNFINTLFDDNDKLLSNWSKTWAENVRATKAAAREDNTHQSNTEQQEIEIPVEVLPAEAAEVVHEEPAPIKDVTPAVPQRCAYVTYYELSDITGLSATVINVFCNNEHVKQGPKRGKKCTVDIYDFYNKRKMVEGDVIYGKPYTDTVYKLDKYIKEKLEA